VVDQNLPLRLVDLLIGFGHEAVHVKALGMSAAPDMAIWRHAMATDAIVVSKDGDFLAFDRSPGGGARLLLLHVGNVSNTALFQRLLDSWPSLVNRFRAGDRLVELR
jgi:predicted nuclease of predicted toxin-antitoxin system